MADLRRSDSYENFKFWVKWDGKVVAGVNTIGALTRRRGEVSWRDGADPSSPRTSRGQVGYEPITLERGMTADVAFERWANKVWYDPNSAPSDQEVAIKDFRKDISIMLLNEAGRVVTTWNIYRCWVSEFTALPDLDASFDAVAILSMTIQNEGWSRDSSVRAPTEPAFDDRRS
jgi:phage tail-like protein